MGLSSDQIINTLTQNLSEEGKWMLLTLSRYGSLYKEELREKSNSVYQERKDQLASSTKMDTLIASRHALDTQTARIEGAGLVTVKNAGQVRVYSISELGKEILKFVISQKTTRVSE